MFIHAISRKFILVLISMQSPDRQIDLFCKLESPDRIHAVIADVFMESAVRSLEVMVCKFYSQHTLSCGFVHSINYHIYYFYYQYATLFFLYRLQRLRLWLSYTKTEASKGVEWERF